MKQRRLRNKKCAPGQLRAYWGREDRYSAPDLMLAHGGGTCTKRDTTLLYLYLTVVTAGQGCKSFTKELQERGYDITTLEFSIRKTPVTT